LISYSGVKKFNQSKDAFIFFLSQLCIWVEQAFGMQIMKWHVFKKPLEVKFGRMNM
jgi:hypothetical protein